MAIERLDARRLRSRIEATVAARVSPERTRRATLTERLTVSLMPWRRLVQLNRLLEILGKTATTFWVLTVAGIIFGLDLRDTVAHVFNAGRPVEGLIAAAIIIPTVIFLLLRSAIGYCRWRVQRELWRRDVRRLTRVAQDAGLSPDALVAIDDKGSPVIDSVIGRLSAVAKRDDAARDDEPPPAEADAADAPGADGGREPGQGAADRD